MSNSYCINFSYKNPADDFINSIGYNPDNSVNIKYTLLALQETLQKNIDIIENLIKYSDKIDEINSINYNLVSIKITDSDIKKELMEQNTIFDAETIENDIIDNLPISEETNEERLQMLRNITNNEMFDFFSDNQEEEQNNFIKDGDNLKYIINKYTGLLSDVEYDEEYDGDYDADYDETSNSKNNYFHTSISEDELSDASQYF